MQVGSAGRSQPRGPALGAAREREDLVAEPVAARARVLHDVAGVDERAEQPVGRAAAVAGALGDLDQAGVLDGGERLEHGEAADERVNGGVAGGGHACSSGVRNRKSTQQETG